MRRMAVFGLLVLAFCSVAYADMTTINFTTQFNTSNGTTSSVSSVATLQLQLNADGTIAATLTGSGVSVYGLGLNGLGAAMLSSFSPITPQSDNTSWWLSGVNSPWNSGFVDWNSPQSIWTFTISDPNTPYTSVFDVASFSAYEGAPVSPTQFMLVVPGASATLYYGGNAPAPSSVPEPSTAVLLISGLAGVAGLVKRRVV